MIPKLLYVPNGTHRTHTSDDEAIWFLRVLESLLAASFKVASLEKPLRKEADIESSKSCSGGSLTPSAIDM